VLGLTSIQSLKIVFSQEPATPSLFIYLLLALFLAINKFLPPTDKLSTVVVKVYWAVCKSLTEAVIPLVVVCRVAILFLLVVT